MPATNTTATSRSLPAPSPEALAASDALAARIADEIAAAGGWLGFERFMALALYTPQLGYYSGGATKFAAAGDFTTAPEMTPLFAQALARQVASLLRCEGLNAVLEFGAGSGRLAAELLNALHAQGLTPRYAILDVSGELRARQQAMLATHAPQAAEQVQWLSALPENFEGVVLTNEVLDAMPVKRVRRTATGWCERGVVRGDDGFAFADGPACAGPDVDWAAQLPEGYETELPLQAAAFMHGLGGWLQRGAALFIDYGFPQAEFYHPQRLEGTLIAHYRHRAHGDLLRWPGLQDITAHVDFTAMALAAQSSGLDVLGYCSQARFLLNCGVLDLLQQLPPGDEWARLRETSAVQKLLAESEMGELFKVLAVGRGVSAPALMGFAQGDRTHTL